MEVSAAAEPLSDHELWLANPLVSYAREIANDDPLETIETLYLILGELEDKVPGVPFKDMLDPEFLSRNRMVQDRIVALLGDRAPTDPDELKEMVGSVMLNVWTDLDIVPELAAAILDGLSPTDLIAEGFKESNITLHRARLGFIELSARQRAIGEEILDGGRTIDQAREAWGCSRTTARLSLYGLLSERSPILLEVAA